jgi:hypothetical protein
MTLKVLTATVLTQGQRHSDFAWCLPGELVRLPLVICGLDEAEGPDGGCGCGRSFIGLGSAKATTTTVVTTMDGWAPGDLARAVSESLQRHWPGRGDARAMAQAVARIAGAHDAGDILEVRLGKASRREPGRELTAASEEDQ